VEKNKIRLKCLLVNILEDAILKLDTILSSIGLNICSQINTKNLRDL